MAYTDTDVLGEIEELIQSSASIKSKRGRKPKPKSLTSSITVTSHQKQFLDFIQPNKKEQILECDFAGATGSGKTLALCIALLKYIQHPNVSVLLLHKHLSSLKKTTLISLLKERPDVQGNLQPPLLPPEAIKSFNKTEGIINLWNGSKIIVSGVGDDSKLRSINCTAAFIDELSNIEESDYFSILQRCRVYSPLPNAVMSCTNPGNRNSWIYKRFVEKEISDYRTMISVPAISNMKNLPASYLKSLDELPIQERKRMFLGEWTVSGKEVFYCWDQSKFVQDLSGWKREDYQEYMFGSDLGGGAKYSGTLLIGKKDDKYYVLDEFSKLKTTHKEILDWLEKYRHLTELVAYDPANCVFRTDLENSSYIPLKPNKDIENGVSKMNSLFSEGRIIVNESCKKLIQELSSATRDEDTNRWLKDKQEIDMVDALRYGLICFDDNGLTSQYNKPTGNVFCFSF